MRPSAQRRSAGQPTSIALARTQATKTALADLQHLTVGTLARDVVLARGELCLAKHHATLVDQSTRLRAGDPELLGDQPGQVDHAAVALKAGLLDLLGGLMVDEHAVEMTFRRRGVLWRVKPGDQIQRNAILAIIETT